MDGVPGVGVGGIRASQIAKMVLGGMVIIGRAQASVGATEAVKIAAAKIVFLIVCLPNCKAIIFRHCPLVKMVVMRASRRRHQPHAQLPEASNARIINRDRNPAPNPNGPPISPNSPMGEVHSFVLSRFNKIFWK